MPAPRLRIRLPGGSPQVRIRLPDGPPAPRVRHFPTTPQVSDESSVTAVRVVGDLRSCGILAELVARTARPGAHAGPAGRPADPRREPAAPADPRASPAGPDPALGRIPQVRIRLPDGSPGVTSPPFPDNSASLRRIIRRRRTSCRRLEELWDFGGIGCPGRRVQALTRGPRAARRIPVESPPPRRMPAAPDPAPRRIPRHDESTIPRQLRKSPTNHPSTPYELSET